MSIEELKSQIEQAAAGKSIDIRNVLNILINKKKDAIS
jgi:hypothetical protein